MKNKNLINFIPLLICFLYNNVSSQINTVKSGTSVNIASGTIFSVDGLDITPSSNYVLNASISKNSAVSNATTFPYLPRVYSFSQTTNSFSGTLKINYTDTDLVGSNLIESNLKVIYHTSNWTFDSSSTNNANANSTISSSLSAIALDEITLAACLQVTTSNTIKLANQSTHVKYLSNSLSSWSLLSGVDVADFSLNPSLNSQELVFNNAAVFASPQDSDFNNVYLVNVSNGCEIQNLSIQISPFCGYFGQN